MSVTLGSNAQLALDTIHRKPAKGIPTWGINIMEHSMMERVAGVKHGEYMRDPEATYLMCQKKIGVSMIDQYIPRNPLGMGEHGYEGKEHGATTGATEIFADGIRIDSPEAVVRHMEEVLFPRFRREMENPSDEIDRAREIIENERDVQEQFGPDILKVPYGISSFPYLDYGTYGYVHYFTAFITYPEVMEKCFSLAADVCLPSARAAARAYEEGNLPPLLRLDHDIADSRGILVGLKALERLWLPHFVRAIQPLLDSDIRLLWHCDGNLMELLPVLLDIGFDGFQGFQYEDGMDYERICAMRTRSGDEPIIIAGSSVSRTLPFGTAEEVKEELDRLVKYGPKTGLFLGCSSSMAPGVPWENIETLVEGLGYYRTHGRG
jgi:uroporphyrinogen decarboxylase